MKRVLLSIGLLVSGTASAAMGIDLTKTDLPYSDVGLSSTYALPVSVLTSEGVLEGNPDGTFRPNRTLNRAEFLKIAISLRHPGFEKPVQPCFPDVDRNAWYADSVCFAKSWNFVSGYPDGTFQPESPVNYVEALKMLSEIFGYQLNRKRGDEWFTPYLRAAKEQGTALPPTTPLSDPISRGEMAMLAAQFLAESRFELEQYRLVESGELVVTKEEPTEEEPTTVATGETGEGSAMSSSSSSAGALLPNQLYVPTNPLPSINASSDFMVLGERNKVLAAIQVSPDDEPVEIREVKITLDSAVSSINAFEVFDDVGYVLGTAAIDLTAGPSGNVYTLNLSPENAYYIAKDDQIGLAVRPRTKPMDSGGVSGQEALVSQIEITAIGRWSSKPNLVETSGSDFQTHVTSLATIESIERVGSEIGVFATGTNKKIGEFRFTARSNSDPEADPAITALTFSVSAPSEVSLTNAKIRGNDVDTELDCTILAGLITCSSIPGSIGNLQSSRTISVYADVTLSSHPDPFLMVELNNPGNPASAGDITWTDGESTFTWVPFDSPIAQGTSWR